MLWIGHRWGGEREGEKVVQRVSVVVGEGVSVEVPMQAGVGSLIKPGS